MSLSLAAYRDRMRYSDLFVGGGKKVYLHFGTKLSLNILVFFQLRLEDYRNFTTVIKLSPLGRYLVGAWGKESSQKKLGELT